MQQLIMAPKVGWTPSADHTGPVLVPVMKPVYHTWSFRERPSTPKGLREIGFPPTRRSVNQGLRTAIFVLTC